MNDQTRPQVTTKEGTFEVRFDAFASLPARKGQDFVDSTEFTCFGHKWRLRIYPGGEIISKDGYVAIYLHNLSEESIEIDSIFTVKNLAFASAMQVCRCNFKAGGVTGISGQGWTNFASWPAVIGALEGGALFIQLKMVKTGPSSLDSSPFFPENPLYKNILKKFMDGDSADVVFEVGSGKTESACRKRAKTSPTTFYAHRFVLQESSPVLAELCKSKGELIPIPIVDVKPEIFHHLLHYMYGGKLDYAELKADSMDIIDAADKFGVVNLKLEAEARYVKTTELGIDNMLANLVYADTRNCALLKEAVMDFVVGNGIEVEEKVSLKDVSNGLFADLLNAMNRGRKRDTAGNGAELSMMRVSDLRKKLHEKGLDVDGSRETMIAALKELPSTTTELNATV